MPRLNLQRYSKFPSDSNPVISKSSSAEHDTDYITFRLRFHVKHLLLQVAFLHLIIHNNILFAHRKKNKEKKTHQNQPNVNAGSEYCGHSYKYNADLFCLSDGDKCGWLIGKHGRHQSEKYTTSPSTQGCSTGREQEHRRNQYIRLPRFEYRKTVPSESCKFLFNISEKKE